MARWTQHNRIIVTLDDIKRLIRVCRHGQTCHKCCHLWLGRKKPSGYGQIYSNRTTYPASRLLYILTYNAELTSKEHICHTCDNPPCCNVNHLYKGNALTNGRDRAKRHRVKTGVHHRYLLPRKSSRRVGRETKHPIKESYQSLLNRLFPGG